jgi:two-component system NtrC family sensor kinase
MPHRRSAREDRAMVLLSNGGCRARRQGRCWLHVQAGVLLNRNLPLHRPHQRDRLPAGSLPFGSQGTATLFLDDVRISTNVRLFGPAARGTRHRHPRVAGRARRVLGRGADLAGPRLRGQRLVRVGLPAAGRRAGQRVGMLYVGFLERRSRWLKYGVLAGIGALLRGDDRCGAGLAALGAQHLPPLEQMEAHHAAREGRRARRARGRRGQRRRDRPLAATWTSCWTSSTTRRALQRWNAELDAKVAERTRNWKPRAGSSCSAARSWPPWASSRPASRTRSTTRSP